MDKIYKQMLGDLLMLGQSAAHQIVGHRGALAASLREVGADIVYSLDIPSRDEVEALRLQLAQLEKKVASLETNKTLSRSEKTKKTPARRLPSVKLRPSPKKKPR